MREAIVHFQDKTYTKQSPCFEFEAYVTNYNFDIVPPAAGGVVYSLTLGNRNFWDVDVTVEDKADGQHYFVTEKEVQ